MAAVAENGVIGSNNDLPWQDMEDMEFFRKETMGHVVVMGRLTWDSLPNKPLDGRVNIVISSTLSFDTPGAYVARNFLEAMHLIWKHSGPHDKVFVIGGQTMYEQFLPYARRVLLTLIKGTYKGTTKFPPMFNKRYAKDTDPRSISDGE